jgi:hypothetical protein
MLPLLFYLVTVFERQMGDVRIRSSSVTWQGHRVDVDTRRCYRIFGMRSGTSDAVQNKGLLNPFS